MSDERDQEIADLKARLAAVETSGEKPKPRGSKVVTIVIVVALLGLLSLCLQLGSTTSGGSSSTSAWAPPAGYSLADTTRGGAVAYKWEDPTADDCRSSRGACFAMTVVTERDCSRNLYASVSLLNAGGSNIGWTNDSAKGVLAGDPTRLVFNSYEDGVDSARIAEISCY